MDKRKIWGYEIPGNSDNAKASDMELHEMSAKSCEKGFMRDVFTTDLMEDSRYLDTFTEMKEIQAGIVSPFYRDEPTVIPYLSDGSDIAMIVAPGGGFCMQSREMEGYEIAEALNARGISAFVLDYRLNPYRAPYPYLDVQRAIRYVRFHAAEFGIHPDKIGAMGFSAGAYVTGASQLLLEDAAPSFPGYTPDEIDSVSGRANFLGMLYPVTGFDQNQNMLECLVGDAFYNDQTRMQLWHEYSLTEHLNEGCAPQFLCFGTKDPLKGMPEYDAKLTEKNIPHKTLILKGAEHGFGLTIPKYNYWLEELADWIRITANEG